MAKTSTRLFVGLVLIEAALLGGYVILNSKPLGTKSEGPKLTTPPGEKPNREHRKEPPPSRAETHGSEQDVTKPIEDSGAEHIVQQKREPTSDKGGMDERSFSEQKRIFTPEETEYLRCAAIYHAGGKHQSTSRPHLYLPSKGSVGHLPGSWRVCQVIDTSTSRVQSEDANITIWVDGVSTEGEVDGAFVGFGSIVFLVKGTKSYETILGARRTVYWIEALDSSLFAWAMDQIAEAKRKNAARIAAEQQAKGRIEKETRRAAIKPAEAAVAAAVARLEDFEMKNRRIRDYITSKAMVENYKANLLSPRIAQLLKEEQAKLDALGEVSEEEIQEYKKSKEELQKRIRDARAALASLPRPTDVQE